MQIVEWLSRLIAFDTTSRNSNVELIHLVQDWFTRHHIQSRLTHDGSEKKANLFATLPASNGNTQGGIILSGHTDVVPVDGQHWNTNPFEAVLIEDRIYGRGTSDMKGFLAVALTLVPEFQQMQLNHPVHFAFSYDEEVGCRGVPLLISDLQQIGIQPKACIVGEPSEMKPIVGHKGIQGFCCKVKGLAAHSSLTPQGCNAIEYAARLITHLRHFADEMRQHGPFDEHFDVPFTSLSTNMIQGGNAHNTIPEWCEFIFEFRHLPQVEPTAIQNKIEALIQNELLPAIWRESADAAIVLERTGGVAAFEANEAALITRLARQISGDKQISKVAYATEAGLFEDANIPTIVCGPGSIEQAHRPNEFVAVEQLKQCETFLRKIVKQFDIVG